MHLRRLSLALLVTAAALSAGCAMLDAKQREWIFQPSNRSWSGADTSGMQDVWINYTPTGSQEPVRLHGLWMPSAAKAGAAKNTTPPLLLYLHGARWNVAGSSQRIRRMQSLGFSVLAIDYRGFGQSSAELPSQTSALQDARAAWDWLATQAPGQPRYIFGHSLGGAIAIDLAASVSDEAGVMVEGTFTSIADVVSTFRWGWLPVAPLITQPFDSINKVAHLNSPLLVVHGSNDQLIIPRLGRTLFEAAAQPKRFVLVEGGTHHNTQALAMDTYRSAMAELFGLPAADHAHQ
jgi:fermentation-respiration switch protein FrsA (DUF1100 family)